MTTEEKYNKALELARTYYNGGNEFLDTIFPELKESEDERIRKEISTLYSDIDDCITELLKARTDKDSEAEGKALFKMEGLMVATLQDLSRIEDYLEKQEEQKPVEWSDEDEKFAYFVNQFLGYYENADPTAMSCKKWFNNRFKSIKPQTKAEWSEGEKKMLSVISYKISQHQGNDERSLFTPDEAEFISGMEDKFKSLCPVKRDWKPVREEHWKPSEEQMEALAWYSGNSGVPPTGDKAIKSLYTDLQKLI